MSSSLSNIASSNGLQGFSCAIKLKNPKLAGISKVTVCITVDVSILKKLPERVLGAECPTKHCLHKSGCTNTSNASDLFHFWFTFDRRRSEHALDILSFTSRSSDIWILFLLFTFLFFLGT